MYLSILSKQRLFSQICRAYLETSPLAVIGRILIDNPLFSLMLVGKSSRILSWWCFNPGIAMKEFERLNVRSVIMTSGTLSPLDSFALEMSL